MGTESKGRAWLGKIYKKLETILVEVDTFTSQSTLCLRSSEPSEWESVRGEEEEDPSYRSCDSLPNRGRLALTSSGSPSDPPTHVRVEEASSSSALEVVETLSGAPSATTLGNDDDEEESRITNTQNREEVRVESWTDFVSTVSQSTQCSMESFGVLGTRSNDTSRATIKISTDDIVQNQDNLVNTSEGNLNDVKSDGKALYDTSFQENPLYINDNELYAVHIRTKRLRSFKRRILDALTSRRIREKEYEQLAIWFGDAAMGSDLVPKEDPKLLLESEDYQWELL